MTMYELKEAEEKVILVGVQLNENEPAEESLDELGELAKTAGAEVVGRMIQSREYIHPATYIGKGKIRSSFLKYILINDAVSIHQFWHRRRGVYHQHRHNVLSLDDLNRQSIGVCH